MTQSSGPTRDAAVAPTRFPMWAQAAGLKIGAGTLGFFMLVVLLTFFRDLPTSARFPIVAVLALGMALSAAFVGGAAIAEGKIPLPLAERNPIGFSVGGGVAVFIVVFIIGNLFFPGGPAPVPVQTYSFQASNEDSPFAVKTKIEGGFVVSPTSIKIHVDVVSFGFPKVAPDGNGRVIESIRALLVRDGPGGSWGQVAASSPRSIQRELSVGGTCTDDDFDLEIALAPGQVIAGHSLVFEASERSTGTDASRGVSNVFTDVLLR